jgi:hypothetical protein
MNIRYLRELATNPTTPKGKAAVIAVKYLPVYAATNYQHGEFTDEFLLDIIECAGRDYIVFINGLTEGKEGEREQISFWLILFNAIFEVAVRNELKNKASIAERECYRIVFEGRKDSEASLEISILMYEDYFAEESALEATSKDQAIA